MRFETLADWLHWQEKLHPRSVDLGLSRCGRVAARMGLSETPFVIVTVGGTNGKGSCVAMLEAILQAAGYHTGVYTTPHLLRYNERVRTGGREVADGVLVDAFERIDSARGDTSLTYYEFGTLAALDIFRRESIDVALLEVGLGGRLDAVNVFDADVALLSTVDVDHVDWLGMDREGIGREKAGIFRRGRPAVCGESDPPGSLAGCARELDVRLYQLGRDFRFQEQAAEWTWIADDGVRISDLPRPGIDGSAQVQNAASVLMVLQLLGHRLSVPDEALRSGLREARLPARFQVLPGEVERILDVAHNVQAARSLACSLQARACAGRTLAVLGMLADKDAAGVALAMREAVDAWYVGGLEVARGESGERLVARLTGIGLRGPLSAHVDVSAAHAAALSAARPSDRIVIFGSFHTAAEILRLESRS